MTVLMKQAASRLKWARERAGYDSARSFCQYHGYAYGTYTGWESGTRGIKPPVAQKLANILGVDAGWLLTGAGNPKKNLELSPIHHAVVYAPVISWIQAGQLGAADMNFGADDFIPVTHDKPTVVALKVLGTSMNRMAPPGSFIVVDYEQTHPYDGMLVVAQIDDEVTFKRYRDASGPIRLEPDSTEQHDTIYPTDDLQILGRVVFITQRT